MSTTMDVLRAGPWGSPSAATKRNPTRRDFVRLFRHAARRARGWADVAQRLSQQGKHAVARDAWRQARSWAATCQEARGFADLFTTLQGSGGRLLVTVLRGATARKN
jgi:hypothetical protein